MLHIVVNPVGASGGTLRTFQKLEPIFQKTDYQVHYSSKEAGITQIVHELTSRHEDIDLVIVGGDGTMNEAVNGIADFEHTRVGFLSCGSGNDLSRSLGLSKNLRENAEQILKGETRRQIDVGKLTYLHKEQELIPDVKNEHLFLISCGIGFDAEICQKAQLSALKKVLNALHIGKLIYILTAFQVIMRKQTTKAVVQIDSQKKEYEKMLFSVAMNEAYEGGGFRFCPLALDHDQLLESCTADGLSRLQFFQLFPLAYSGKHVNHDGVYSDRGTCIEISTEDAMWVHTDGEVACKSNHVRMQLHAHSLKFLQ